MSLFAFDDGNEALSTNAAYVSLAIIVVGYIVPWFTMPRRESGRLNELWFILITLFPIGGLIAFLVSNANMPSKYNIRADIIIFGLLWTCSIANVAVAIYRYHHPLPVLGRPSRIQLQVSYLLLLAMLNVLISFSYWPLSLILSLLLASISCFALYKLWSEDDSVGTVRRLLIVLSMSLVALVITFYWM